MELKYKILWFENEIGWYDSIISSVEDYLQEEGFIPEIIRKDNGNDIDELIRNKLDFDLIIMDLNLAGAQGDSIIHNIREHEFYTDIVFYSQNGEAAVRSKVNEIGADGVYCSSREITDFEEKVQKVIKTTIKKVQDINNMRGLVMAEVSDLDKKMIDLIESYYIKADEKKQKEIKNYIAKKISESYDSRAKQTKRILEEDGFSDFIYKPIFESMQKLISIKHFIKEIKSNEKIESCKVILDEYNKEVIDIRNILAHVNEILIKEDGTKVLKGKTEFEFSDTSCTKVRKDIKKHSTNFADILNIINP